MNACHSLFLLVDVNRDAEYTLFDIAVHRYLDPCFSYIQSQFQSTTMTLLKGDSRSTLPAYSEHHKGEFDLCHLDGGHTYDVFSSDYEHSMLLLKKGGILVFDDYNHTEIKAFVDEKVKLGEVLFLSGPSLLPTLQHALLAKV